MMNNKNIPKLRFAEFSGECPNALKDISDGSIPRKCVIFDFQIFVAKLSRRCQEGRTPPNER